MITGTRSATAALIGSVVRIADASNALNATAVITGQAAVARSMQGNFIATAMITGVAAVDALIQSTHNVSIVLEAGVINLDASVPVAGHITPTSPTVGEIGISTPSTNVQPLTTVSVSRVSIGLHVSTIYLESAIVKDTLG
jgi:hypothetical protein